MRTLAFMPRHTSPPCTTNSSHKSGCNDTQSCPPQSPQPLGSSGKWRSMQPLAIQLSSQFPYHTKCKTLGPPLGRAPKPPSWTWMQNMFHTIIFIFILYPPILLSILGCVYACACSGCSPLSPVNDPNQEMHPDAQFVFFYICSATFRIQCILVCPMICRSFVDYLSNSILAKIVR